MKKLLLSLGTVTALATPVVAVVACGSSTSYTSIIEITSEKENNKYKSFRINLDFKWDVPSNAKEIAVQFMTSEKTNFEDSTKVTLRSQAGSIEKTFAEFKALAATPAELLVASTQDKATEINKYINEVFTALKTAAA